MGHVLRMQGGLLVGYESSKKPVSEYLSWGEHVCKVRVLMALKSELFGMTELTQ